MQVRIYENKPPVFGGLGARMCGMDIVTFLALIMTAPGPFFYFFIFLIKRPVDFDYSQNVCWSWWMGNRLESGPGMMTFIHIYFMYMDIKWRSCCSFFFFFHFPFDSLNGRGSLPFSLPRLLLARRGIGLFIINALLVVRFFFFLPLSRNEREEEEEEKKKGQEIQSALDQRRNKGPPNQTLRTDGLLPAILIAVLGIKVNRLPPLTAITKKKYKYKTSAGFFFLYSNKNRKKIIF